MGYLEVLSLKDGKEFIVVNVRPKDYKVPDMRSKKPLTFKQNTGSMVLQEIDEIKFNNKYKEERNTLSYFSPNNVGILLSIADKSTEKAKNIFNEHLNPDKIDHRLWSNDGSRLDKIKLDSHIAYDFIESIQVSIVFGYTAIETFANLSIPEEYKYQPGINHRGIEEIYNKSAIERWISLRDKLSIILPEIYNTIPIRKKRVWNDFIRFENLRHEIIHQKSIDETNFYKKYFKKSFFKICSTPKEVLKFFFENRKDKAITNPLWPWLINSENDFPISNKYNPKNFEVIGNLYEGKFKK